MTNALQFRNYQAKDAKIFKSLNLGNLNKFDELLDENIYFEVVNAKTASLFSAACQVGSISALGTEAEINALKSFGTNFGMTFHLTAKE